MRKFFILFKYELNKIFVSSSSYFIAAVFLAIAAVVHIFMLREFVLYDQETPFFHTFLQCFWLPVLLSVPMLTMRTFSEDYKSGLIQSMKTISVSDFAIVCSKFVSTYLFYAILWIVAGLIMGINLLIVPNLLFDASFIDITSFLGGYLYIFLAGLLFISIGIFFSSLTENQILSGMATFVAIFILFLNGQLSTFHGVIRDSIVDHAFIRPLNIFLQLDNACYGVFDSRIVILYLSLVIMFLVFTKVALERKFS